MERRTFLTIALATPLAVAACGSDGEGGDTVPPVTDAPSTDPASPDTKPDTVPGTGADDPFAVEGPLVVEYTVGGGLTTREVAFQQAPSLLVTAEGRVITGTASPAVYPGPLVVQHEVRTITGEGVNALIAAAADAGLLQTVVYADKPQLADAPTTRLVISTPDATHVHSVYGLGIDAGDDALLDPSGDRPDQVDLEAELIAFLDRLADLESLVGADQLGPVETYVPERYQIAAVLLDPDLSGYDPEPTVLDWPLDIDLATLRDTGGCVLVDRADVGDLFDSATQLTFFRQGDAVYQVLVRPDYPGADDC